ncbi:hypothetical protein [Actinopolymorpha rutila]|uniref:Uncharacterized protein n=1 Tax=Actinopolymorpha rutila TaxID=446787 RepID=A0A852ZQ54_9ACTN|nr:hypothetical protein [Actinopolymorpha rutila]NYH91160.1 hypothetical protein [Actinopolymorpha rutila]
MLLLAGPMTVLCLAAEIVARTIERRRRARLADQGLLLDDIDTDTESAHTNTT